MKRFWKDVALVAVDSGWGIQLDGRPVRTPARALLQVPGRPLADAIAAEWAAQGQDVDPRTMPNTGFANAAIDRIAPDPAPFIADLARYAEADLLCYRADSPAALVTRQAAQWDPLLEWARSRFDIDFALTSGILHCPQPQATIAHLSAAIAAFDPLRLAALSPLITISGSVVIALAVVEGTIDPDTAFATAHLDELWQVEQWGEDDFGLQTRTAHHRDFVAATDFLALLV